MNQFKLLDTLPAMHHPRAAFWDVIARFIFAAACVGLLLLAEHLVTLEIFTVDMRGDLVASAARHQPALLYRSALLSEQLIAETDEARREQLRHELRVVLNMMAANHNLLIAETWALDENASHARELMTLLYEAPRHLHRKLRRYVRDMDALIAAPAQLPAATHPARLTVAREDRLRDIAGSLESLAELHLAAQRDVLAYWRWVRSIVSWALVVVLVLTALLVFQPLLRRVRREAHAARQERDYVTAVLHTVRNLVVVCDPSGTIVRCNRAFEEITGHSAAVWQGKPLWECMASERDQEAMRRVFADAASGRLPKHLETRCATAEGGARIIGWSFGLMLGSLGDIQHIVGAGSDVTDHRTAERRLRRMNAKLAESNRELRDFSSVAAHDLREPLASIQFLVEHLHRQLAPPILESVEEVLRRIAAVASRMQQLINDLLLYAKVTTEAHPFEPVDLTRVARLAVGDCEARIERYGGRVEIATLPTIEADAGQMRQLFQNLISNALKYHHPERAPEVVVRGAVEQLDNGEAQCRIEVVDNGIGFPEKYVDRIFDIFQRLHSHEAYEGTGVGLAVCRKIVERHGGAITAKSTPGKGSTFIVILPARRNGGDEAEAAEGLEP